MTDQKDIKTIPVYDRSGKVIGSVTGRRDDVERFSNNDLAQQIKSDEQKHRENLRRK